MSQQDCPSANAMVSTFPNVDQATSTAWTTQVRDNDREPAQLLERLAAGRR